MPLENSIWLVLSTSSGGRHLEEVDVVHLALKEKVVDALQLRPCLRQALCTRVLLNVTYERKGQWVRVAALCPLLSYNSVLAS